MGQKFSGGSPYLGPCVLTNDDQIWPGNTWQINVFLEGTATPHPKGNANVSAPAFLKNVGTST